MSVVARQASGRDRPPFAPPDGRRRPQQPTAAVARAVGGQRDLVTVLPCDASARIVHPLCRGEGIPLMDGGRTDLRTGFAKALRSPPRPDAIAVLTDGQAPWPTSRPPCRTVVGLFPRRGGSWDEDDPDHVPRPPPAWARVVEIGSVPSGDTREAGGGRCGRLTGTSVRAMRARPKPGPRPPAPPSWWGRPHLRSGGLLPRAEERDTASFNAAVPQRG